MLYTRGVAHIHIKFNEAISRGKLNEVESTSLDNLQSKSTRSMRREESIDAKYADKTSYQTTRSIALPADIPRKNLRTRAILRANTDTYCYAFKLAFAFHIFVTFDSSGGSTLAKGTIDRTSTHSPPLEMKILSPRSSLRFAENVSRRVTRNEWDNDYSFVDEKSRADTVNDIADNKSCLGLGTPLDTRRSAPRL